LLRQAVAHCARSLAAASRRSLGRISVPVWLATLSGQLPIVALVGRYPPNQLIGRKLPRSRPSRAYPRGHLHPRAHAVLAPLSEGYPPRPDRSLTRSSPVRRWAHPRRDVPARLACVRHAASVYPEPGSNSPSNPCQNSLQERASISESHSVARTLQLLRCPTPAPRESRPPASRRAVQPSPERGRKG
jgi:hypothetical protein